MLLLAGCAGSGSQLRDVVRRDLPAAPAYLAAGRGARAEGRRERAVAVAARERAGRLKANTIIRNARAQWEKLRRVYAKAR